MAPNQSKLTLHPWLDAPLYNRIRYPQWKIYLYNAAQKMCTSLDLTGAYCLVARQDDWDTHPKNFTPYRPPSPGGLHPAVTRPRPTFTMPAFFTRNSTTFERAQWKFDKECFEKYDEAETILHSAIVESLSQGTIRMINTQNVAGIASLSALQLVEVIHKLYSTPTLQDITTVETDLKRPLNNFEDFLDHVTDHINHYESLRSFNQQVSNITKIQTFKESIKRWPQFDSLIDAWELSNNNVLTRDFSSFTDYLISQYGNLPTDAKPRGGNAFNANKGKKGKGKGKGHKGKDKQNKGRSRGAGRYVYWDTDDAPQSKRPRYERQASSAVNNTDEPIEPSTPEDTASVRSHTSARSSASSVNQVHGTNTTTQLTSSQTNPDPSLYFYCHYHGWNLSHSGDQCRVMLNDTSYLRAHKEAASPADTNPPGNICIEPERTEGRTRPYLKAWGTYSR